MIKLTEADIAHYRDTGWYISPLKLDDALLDACVEAAEGIYGGRYDHVQPWSDSPLFPNFDQPYVDRSELRVDQFPSFHCDAIAEVVHSREIAAIAAQLMGAKELRYYKDILIGTPAVAEGSAIGWHTDISYWPTCVATSMITVYVPLQRRTRDNGTLLMMSGSQRWPASTLNLTAAFEDLDKLKRKYEAAGRVVELHDLPHERGQVSFHSSLVIHATFPNQTDEFQHSIVYGLQAETNRFVPSHLKRFDPNLVVNLNDEISPKRADGTPDLKDPSFYPLLYSESSEP